jgi:hypothetical protein
MALVIIWALALIPVAALGNKTALGVYIVISFVIICIALFTSLDDSNSSLKESASCNSPKSAKNTARKYDIYADGYESENGYQIIHFEGETHFLHRLIAKDTLGRDLRAGEVVHHINGQRLDNLVSNLCVMSREEHDRWHTWLRTLKNYPSLETQRELLTIEHNGILLDVELNKKSA